MLCLGLALLVLLPACDDATAPDPAQPAAVTVEPFADPQIEYDASRGTTTIIVRFVARQGDRPLGEDDIDVELKVNEKAVDVEGILQQDSEALSANLHITLVLDTSYSMLQHSPSAFAPMLSSARRTLQAASGLYTDRPGSFEWDLVWFDDAIFRPVITSPSMRWTPQDVERIPTPSVGSFTKLYAAMDDAIRSSINHAALFGGGPRDQHIVVAFSDGADNYSWFDNADVDGQGSLDSSRQYHYYGASPTTRADVESLLKASPEIQLHMMGLGSAVNDADMQALSKAGRGRYFKNLDASKVDQLFDKVILEFTSVQTQGVTLPLPPGQYRFTAKVTAQGASGSYSFSFMGGQEGAGLVR